MNRRAINDKERRDWLRLSSAENVGPITFRQLIARFGTASAALEALPSLAARGGKKSFTIPAVGVIDDMLARTAKFGGKFIALCEPDYPEALAATEDAPPLITVIGQITLLHKRAIGVVGARNASLNGRKLAEVLARDLGKEEIVIVSGLAAGSMPPRIKAALPAVRLRFWRVERTSFIPRKTARCTKRSRSKAASSPTCRRVPSRMRACSRAEPDYFRP